MKYNLTPFLTLLTERVPNADVWRERFTSFFNNEDYDPELTDWYYDKLINNVWDVEQMLKSGCLVDEYTGLFSFASSNIETAHSFNAALFVSGNVGHFYKKKILTICHDYGILNVQMKLCGLDVVSSVQKEFLNPGTVLTCIGNNSPPYPINRMEFPEEDVVFLSSVFDDDELAYVNWNYMLDKRLEGKEVFFTSNSFYHLRRYINYDRIDLVADPKKVYKPDDYADLSYGYMNKIYRLK